MVKVKVKVKVAAWERLARLNGVPAAILEVEAGIVRL
jgi:hypothetical protein